MQLPLPPHEMRILVGPTDDSAYDNPTGQPLADVDFPIADLDLTSVLDFGCGCGRIARQLIQQRRQPGRYLGVDLHAGMIDWCKTNLTPAAPQFRFEHLDIYELAFNPNGQTWVPFPAADDEFTAVLANSVFTHIIESDLDAYLEELRRVLRNGGVALTTWFTFDKSGFPMMQDSQNALYINPMHPQNAVIYDRAWLTRRLNLHGLAIAAITPPRTRGFQWLLRLTPGASAVDWPDDLGPLGTRRAGEMPSHADRIGLDELA